MDEITVDPDLAESYLDEVENVNEITAPDFDKCKELRWKSVYEGPWPEPKFKPSTKNDYKKYKGKVIPRCLDNPLNRIADHVPFFREIKTFPHDEIGWPSGDEEKAINRKEGIRRCLTRRKKIPNWEGTDAGIEMVDGLIPSTLLEYVNI